MIEAVNGIKSFLQSFGPVLIIILIVMFVGWITRGYRGFINAVKDILSNKWSLLFFIIMCGIAIYYFNKGFEIIFK
jgi:succinate dehydrogenase hydrophobic anchor subunit